MSLFDIDSTVLLFSLDTQFTGSFKTSSSSSFISLLKQMGRQELCLLKVAELPWKCKVDGKPGIYKPYKSILIHGR